MRNEWIIEFNEELNTKSIPCIACDEIGDTLFFTISGKGPFCADCFESLCDPDQAIILEDRLAAYESARDAKT